MKMRANFLVEVDAPDFIGAADHQRSIEALFEVVRSKYPFAQLSFKAVRETAPTRTAPSRRRQLMPTGNLSHYEDPA
jgi:hypothetical protein